MIDGRGGGVGRGKRISLSLALIFPYSSQQNHQRKRKSINPKETLTRKKASVQTFFPWCNRKRDSLRSCCDSLQFFFSF